MSLYLEHFGLREAPFRITPHTDFFFSGGNRGATLEALSYAITHDEGIVKVTGEVGSGKTMLCRMLLEKLPATVETIYLANPSLNREELLYALADELKLPEPPERLHKLTRALQQHLVDLYAAGRQVVMLIDEAHAMPAESLEEVRLLSNLESNRHKLLQIVLFGQPELDELLVRNEMRQLRERITHNFALEPLHHQDVGGYITFRLRAAGYHGPDPFTASAVKLLADASAGLTRRINIVADKALLAAFSENTHRIDTAQAKAAIRDASFGPTPAAARPAKQRQNQIAAALGMLIVVAAAAWIYLLNIATAPATQAATPGSAAPALPAAGSPAPAAVAAVAAPPAERPQTRSEHPPAPTLLKERLAAFNAWLPGASNRHYFIQLLRTRADSPRDVEAFLASVAPKVDIKQLRAYQSTVGQEQWIGVIYGDFNSRDEAAKAIGDLPAEARASNPYARSVSMLR